MPKTLATATVDRVLQHAHLCVTVGDSVRLADATADAEGSCVFHPRAMCLTVLGVVKRAHAQHRKAAGPEQWWGYPAVIVLLTAWWGYIDGSIPVGPVTLLILSLVNAYYFLFRVPTWCRATTRQGESCRNPSVGLLGACHLMQHKWQKMEMILKPTRWRELGRRLWAGARGVLATLATIATIASGTAAVMTLLITKARSR
jgi:hypothetical protein